MTDEELIARLRDACRGGNGCKCSLSEAADLIKEYGRAYTHLLREFDKRGDRIDALVKERDEAIRAERQTYRDAVEVSARAERLAATNERLEALLREARADLAAYVDSDYTEIQRANYPSVERQWHRDMELCRRIDAALKGADHD